jgi:hypothetical protein
MTDYGLTSEVANELAARALVKWRGETRPLNTAGNGGKRARNRGIDPAHLAGPGSRVPSVKEGRERVMTTNDGNKIKVRADGKVKVVMETTDGNETTGWFYWQEIQKAVQEILKERTRKRAMSKQSVARYPGLGAVEPDGPFTLFEYAEWAASEYEGIEWPWTIDLLETTTDGEHIFKVVDPKRILIISVWLGNDGYLHHQEMSRLADYQKYFGE